MGRPDFGNIRKLPSKRWQASYYGPDLARHAAPLTFISKRDAEAWLAPPVFGQYAQQWLPDRSLKPRTREGYEHLLRRYLEPEFGEPDNGPATLTTSSRNSRGQGLVTARP